MPPIAAQSNNQPGGGLDDIMAAFDGGNAGKVAEKSAFDDDDGDLGSDVDDSPQIGNMAGGFANGGTSMTKNLAGIEMMGASAMSLRQ